MHYILSITVSKDKPLIQLSKKVLAPFVPFVIEFEVVTTVSNLIY